MSEEKLYGPHGEELAMNRSLWAIASAFLIGTVLLLSASIGGGQPHQHENGREATAKETTVEPGPGRAPESLPAVPRPDARAAQAPAGYCAEVALADLNYPTSIEFDDVGTMYVAEGGYIYGDDIAEARILRVAAQGKLEVLADQLNGPVTDVLWHDQRLYISHRGKISVLEASGLRDLVTGLPSLGDHHNNQLTVGPDGKIYFGQGTATNSGVVGLDNFKLGWLAKNPDFHDVPAKDIRLTDQAFETPNPLSLLADKRPSPDGKERNEDRHPGAAGEQEAQSHEQHAPKDAGNAQGEHAKHGSTREPVKDSGHADHQESAKKKGSTEHEGPHAGAKSDRQGGHEGHAAQGSGGEGPTADAASSGASQHAGHSGKAAEQRSGSHAGHEGAAPSERSEVHAAHGQAPMPAQEGHEMVKSFAFSPFAKTPPDDGAVRGAVKASGTILRMNPDGSDLEMFAWGLRNPFGVAWGPDGNLYASDNGYDERGSRPIAHAPDCLWVIEQDAWYGFPDYAGGVPVTDMQFAPEDGPIPKFLMRDHPNVEKPLLTLTHHVGAAKIDFSPGAGFGFEGQMFLALAGDMNPITGVHDERSGFEVLRINPESGEAETFFKAKPSSLGPQGMEYVVTAGPRRPVDVRFTPDGNSLYVVDVGAMAILSTATGPAPRPFPGTGVIWRISRDEPSRAAKLPDKPERSKR